MPHRFGFPGATQAPEASVSHHRVNDREQEADRYITMKYLSNLFVSTIHLIRIGGETDAID